MPEIKDDINYLCREGDFAKWDKKRRVAIDTLTIGMLIDFLDNECKWRKAIVSGMLKTYD